MGNKENTYTDTQQRLKYIKIGVVQTLTTYNIFIQGSFGNNNQTFFIHNVTVMMKCFEEININQK